MTVVSNRRWCRWIGCLSTVSFFVTLLGSFMVLNTDKTFLTRRKLAIAFPWKETQPKEREVDEENGITEEILPEDTSSNGEMSQDTIKTLFPTTFGNKTNSETPGEFPYRYIILEENACNDKVEIINMIPISPANKDKRNMFRKLWADPAYLSLTGMKILFLIGLSNMSIIQAEIEYESRTFHDIVQVGFVDSYRNLTLKTFSILHWTKNHCSSAKWILKSDDDVFVNPFALKRYLVKVPSHSDFVCSINENLEVCRPGGKCLQKWAVSRDEWPRDFYPPYCNGPAYVMGADIARRLYEEACKRKPYVMEDVFYSGILAEPLQPLYSDLAYSSFPSEYGKLKTRFLNGISLLFFNPEKYHVDYSYLWNKVLVYETQKCSELMEGNATCKQILIK